MSEPPLIDHSVEGDRRSVRVDYQLGFVALVAGVLIMVRSLTPAHITTEGQLLVRGAVLSGGVMSLFLAALLLLGGRQLAKNAGASVLYWRLLQSRWRPRTGRGLTAVAVISAAAGAIAAKHHAWETTGAMWTSTVISAAVVIAALTGGIRPE